MLAIYKKELRSSLYGMTGPVFIFVVLAVIGFFTASYHFKAGYATFEISVADGAFWSLLFAPVLTMRSFTEERRMKTDQLLYSLPITTTQIVLGKYLALITVFAVPCVIMCAYPAIIAAFSTSAPNFALAYGAILAYFLLGCTVIAIGVFISSLFESLVICAIVNLAALIALYFARSAAGSFSDSPLFTLAVFIILSALCALVVYLAVKNYVIAGTVGGILNICAVIVYLINAELYTGLGADIIGTLFIFTPVTAFAYNVFDITAFIYYITAAALFVLFTVQSVEKRRWS
ncbi:MAG: ABC transporter permease [Clostridia bacterium]|nr:ABC transporter permease [Clostridia bacterium]